MVEIVHLLAFKEVARQMGSLYSYGKLDLGSLIIHSFSSGVFFWDIATHLWRIKASRAGMSGREAFPHGRLATAWPGWWQRYTKSH